MTARAQIRAENDVEFPTDAVIRRNAAKRDAQARWRKEYARISEALQADYDEIDRRFAAGEFG